MVAASGKDKNYTYIPDCSDLPIPEDALYVPRFRETCLTCGSRPICNGCSDCGRCKSPLLPAQTGSADPKGDEAHGA